MFDDLNEASAMHNNLDPCFHYFTVIALMNVHAEIVSAIYLDFSMWYWDETSQVGRLNCCENSNHNSTANALLHSDMQGLA